MPQAGDPPAPPRRTWRLRKVPDVTHPQMTFGIERSAEARPEVRVR
jgi:hypothetical protein